MEIFINDELRRIISRKVYENITSTDDQSSSSIRTFRVDNKINHSRRVRLISNYIATKEGIKPYPREVLNTASVMHDISKFQSDKFHAMMGGLLARQILIELNVDSNFADDVCTTISTHSNKEYYNSHLTKIQKILIEADILEHMMLVNFQTVMRLKLINEKHVILNYPKEEILDIIDRRINKASRMYHLFSTKTGIILHKKLLKSLKKYRKKIYKQICNVEI